MKKIVSVVLMAALLAVSSLAFAAEVKVVATVEKIVVEGTTAKITIKDSKGAKIDVIVKDQLTIDKLNDKRIVVGDEVRVGYDSDTKEAKKFRKTAGC